MKILQILVLIFGLSVFANAQKVHLSGIVTDQVGGIIPKVKVEIRGNKDQKYFIQTNDEGIFQINLQEGIYNIKFEFSGHKSFTVKNYRIGSYRTMKLDIVLYAKPTPII